MRIAVPKEIAAHERRVALVPDMVRRLTGAGHEVILEHGAGDAAGFPDAAYADAGGRLADGGPPLLAGADVIVKVQRPTAAEAEQIPSGAVLIALLQPSLADGMVEGLKARGVTALAMELVPRTTKAQSMDALSSQSTVAGYKAVLLGASELTRLLPMLTTAAGTLAPAHALILGAGVAGLQAIATARRLGAVVSAFDVRPAVKEQVESLGATFVAPDAVTAGAETAGGYARELAAEQQAQVLRAVAGVIGRMDLVISTAQVPGRSAPRLITAEMLRTMRPGSVIVDLAAETGGNCELTRAGETTRAEGVTILGPLNLPSTVPFHASQMYARNITAVLEYATHDGRITVDSEDPILGPMCLTRAPRPGGAA